MEWATLPLKRYAEFTGRSRRKEYWMFFLLILVASIVIGLVEGLLGLSGMVGPYGPLSTLFLLAILIPSIAVGIRRLHDTDRSGWWMLISLVPLVGGIILLVFYVSEGTKGPNQYGPDPKGEDLAQTFA
jgi:uncharacterized membrane protein YhaH (DUF805 family)